jgi:hypothetical protein
VGNHTVKARRLRDLNAAIGGVQPYPGYRAVTLFEQAGSSSYNALQVRVERRFSDGVGFLSSYTWGHAIDDRPGQGAGPSQNYYNMRLERGNADFDVRHNWVVSGSLEPAFGRGRRWGGWSLSAISTLQSGRPFSVALAPPQAFIGNRPNVTGIDWRPEDQNPRNWINGNAFTLQGLSPLGGTLGRNTLTGPGLFNLDVAVSKKHRLSESGQIEFRADFFNVTNHPNFGLPNNLYGSSLGLISSTSSPERQVQLGVKVGF